MNRPFDYSLEYRKVKGKLTVIRLWDKDVFPINPIIGLDFRVTERKNL